MVADGGRGLGPGPVHGAPGPSSRERGFGAPGTARAGLRAGRRLVEAVRVEPRPRRALHEGLVDREREAARVGARDRHLPWANDVATLDVQLEPPPWSAISTDVASRGSDRSSVPGCWRAAGMRIVMRPSPVQPSGESGSAQVCVPYRGRRRAPSDPAYRQGSGSTGARPGRLDPRIATAAFGGGSGGGASQRTADVRAVDDRRRGSRRPLIVPPAEAPVTPAAQLHAEGARVGRTRSPASPTPQDRIRRRRRRCTGRRRRCTATGRSRCAGSRGRRGPTRTRSGGTTNPACHDSAGGHVAPIPGLSHAWGPLLNSSTRESGSLPYCESGSWEKSAGGVPGGPLGTSPRRMAMAVVGPPPTGMDPPPGRARGRARGSAAGRARGRAWIRAAGHDRRAASATHGHEGRTENHHPSLHLLASRLV